MFIYGRWQSPLIWDLLAITTYLTGSIVYLFVPMIPDLALFRDRLTGRTSRWRAVLYRTLDGLEWQCPAAQSARLLPSGVMMILIIPIAVSVHTVVSWIFAMTLRVPWNSALFGAFFVAGAIYSGIAILIIVMGILRRTYKLHEYVTEKHFVYLGYLMAAFAAIMIYANISELLIHGYKLEEGAGFHLRQLFLNDFAPLFWFYLVGGLFAPIAIMLLPATRNIRGVLAAAGLVTVAMWIERYVIVVAGLRVPLLSYEPASYAPTWVEWSILAAGLALFALLITVFIKIFPILAVWEVAEDHEASDPQPDLAHPVARDVPAHLEGSSS